MENKIFITDDNGKELEMNILFTFDMDDQNYVIVYEGDNDEDLYCLKYDDDGNLYVVEDEDELEKAQEVIDAFDGIDDDEEKEED